MRKNREQLSMSLIDWTITSSAIEILNHHTKNEYDMFSDHIPIEFSAKIEYTQQTIKNELITLWNNLKNEWAGNEFRQRIQTAYANIEESQLM